MQEQRVTNPNWGTADYSRIPAERFTSPEFARRERDQLWSRAWQMACRLEEIPEVGDFLEYEIAGASYLVVRSAEDSVKAFVNACLHRGTQLKKGCGSAATLTCPFHAWAWNLDGSIRRVTCPEDFPGVEQEDLALPEVLVGLWGGFVFLNPDPGAEPFERFIEPIAEGVAKYRPEALRIQAYRRMTLQCNWKVALEVFEETYHVPGTHPQVMPFIDDFGTEYELLGDHSLMVVPMGQPSLPVRDHYTEQDAIRGMVVDVFDSGILGPDQRDALEMVLGMDLPEDVTARQFFTTMAQMQFGERLPDISGEQWFQNWQYTVFPNTIINCVPGKLLLHRARPNGDDPDSCIFEFIDLNLYGEGETVPDGTPEIIEDPRSFTAWGLAITQDMANMPRIQAGLHAVPFVRMSSYQEKRLVHRHRVTDAYLQGIAALSNDFGFGVVDAWVNLATGERGREWGQEMAAIDRLFNRSADIILKPHSPAELVGVMDDAGIELAFLTGSIIPGGMVDVFDDLIELSAHVAQIIEQFPGRFVSVPLIAPQRGLAVVRGMRAAVRDYGAKGFHIFPSIIDRSPCDALMYPLYAEAADLGVPMVINVGVPGPMGYADLQAPGHLDRICIDFPELSVVAAHIGAPWQAEVVWLMAKHANLSLMTSAWAPKWYPEEIMNFLRSSRGRHKLMYASDFPIIAFDRAMTEVQALDLDEETRRALLRDNALRIFSIDPSASA